MANMRNRATANPPQIDLKSDRPAEKKDTYYTNLYRTPATSIISDYRLMKPNETSTKSTGDYVHSFANGAKLEIGYAGEANQNDTDFQGGGTRSRSQVQNGNGERVCLGVNKFRTDQQSQTKRLGDIYRTNRDAGAPGIQLFRTDCIHISGRAVIRDERAGSSSGG